MVQRVCLGLLLVGLAVGSLGCDTEDPVGSQPSFDVDALFAAPTDAERAAVEAEWAARTSIPEEIRLEQSTPLNVRGQAGTVHIYSFLIDSSRRYGAVLVPNVAEPGSTPVLLLAPPGAEGSGSPLLLDAVGSYLELGAGAFIFVMPSFRGEPFRSTTQSWVTEGPPSPWDGDVDDALALLDLVFEEVPAADPGRVAALGIGRGGTSVLMMAIRDSRIDAVVSFFGTTDFLGPFMRGVTIDALGGRIAGGVPGVFALYDLVYEPVQAGSMTVAEARHELLLRSPLHFVERLPRVQLHHGIEDPVTPVAESEAVLDALQSLGRGPEEVEAHFYEGVGAQHTAELLGAFAEAREFLLDATSAPGPEE